MVLYNKKNDKKIHFTCQNAMYSGIMILYLLRVYAIENDIF